MKEKNLNLEIIGQRIRRERTSRLIKQETLGKSVNLSKSEISRIENGKREMKLSKLIELAKAIGINPSLLLDEIPRK